MVTALFNLYHYKQGLLNGILLFQRLADIAHTLLKVAPYDPATMRCPGLQM